MHEFGVTQAAFEVALKRAEELGAARITDVHLVLGSVTSIEPSSIRLYWSEISEDSIAEDTALHFRSVPTDCICADCDHRFTVESELLPCPACGSDRVGAVDDEFMALEAIDIEKLPAEGALE